MQTLLSGLGLLESPRWHDGRLWFADWIAGEIIALDPADCSNEVVLRHQSLPLCFDFLPDERLVLVSNQRSALLVLGDDGLESYADLAPLSEFGGGNDIVIDGRGNAYVNNAGFNPMAGPPPAGPTAPGFVALAAPDGSARIVADDLAFPNGMAVTPDNSTLIVAESYRNRLTAFDIGADGRLGGRRVWAELGEGVAPDGICIDAAGAVWFAEVPHQRCVRVAEGGDALETVGLDRGGFACTLGGTDGATLFIVAAHWPGMQGMTADVDWDGQVLSVPAPAPCAGWPGSHERQR
jgi:sugar lactone lactonase YvrE